MSLESVKAWLVDRAPDLRLIEVEETTATVATRGKGARRGAGTNC